MNDQIQREALQGALDYLHANSPANGWGLLDKDVNQDRLSIIKKLEAALTQPQAQQAADGQLLVALKHIAQDALGMRDAVATAKAALLANENGLRLNLGTQQPTAADFANAADAAKYLRGMAGIGGELPRDVVAMVCDAVLAHPGEQAAAVPAGDASHAQYKRMFQAACEALGSINEALGLDPEDGGAEPILGAIARLQETHPSAQYLQGYQDGLDWAACVVNQNDPRTGDWMYDDRTDLANAIHRGPEMPPAAPPAPVLPLSVEQIGELWDGHTVNVFDKVGINPVVFARAIEAAHGITAHGAGGESTT